MSLFSLFSRSSFTPVWECSARFVLWRVMFSGDGLIIAEDRDTESKTVTFFCLDEATGRILWSGQNFGEPWWIGLLGVKDGTLYLHGYKKPDMPEHKHIFAVDVRTGGLKWKNSDCAFLAVSGTDVYGFKDLFERRVFYRIDGGTGVLLEELTALPSDVDHNARYEKTDFRFPAAVPKDGSSVLLKHITGDAVASEYIAGETFTVINTYERNLPPAEGMKNTLVVIDSVKNKRLYSDLLNTSTPYPVPDSFFMDGDRLYYIKERTTLTAVQLKR
ncbi:MAG: DUF4905 domain-containing protein [Bacteroidetes bacterium]|nr:DUF4905 domain-containing protein [Bacteroidota bacterium]